MDRLGIRTPDGIDEDDCLDSFFVADTGMEGYLYADADGNLIAGLCHDAVGLLTYYRLSQSDWDDLTS